MDDQLQHRIDQAYLDDVILKDLEIERELAWRAHEDQLVEEYDTKIDARKKRVKAVVMTSVRKRS